MHISHRRHGNPLWTIMLRQEWCWESLSLRSATPFGSSRSLHANSQVYRDDLTKDQQLVVVHHSIEAIFLSLTFVPLTYLILSLNFEEQSLEALSNKVTALGVLMFGIIIMYMIELASRFQNQRPLVVAHHLCAYLNSIFPAFALSTANLKASSLLVYFITYEAVTFVGLIMYRLCPTNRATRPTIMAGMVIFGLSRPVQIVWILTSLVVSWEHLIVWHAVSQIILSVVFTVLQLYSLNIHYSLYKKCSSIRLQEVDKDAWVGGSVKVPSTSGLRWMGVGWWCRKCEGTWHWLNCGGCDNDPDTVGHCQCSSDKISNNIIL